MYVQRVMENKSYLKMYFGTGYMGERILKCICKTADTFFSVYKLKMNVATSDTNEDYGILVVKIIEILQLKDSFEKICLKKKANQLKRAINAPLYDRVFLQPCFNLAAGDRNLKN